MEKKETFKVEALTRFLFAKTGRIYDTKDVFELYNEADFNYLTKEHKLCKSVSKEAKITETEQDKKDKIAKEAKELEDKNKKEITEVIEKKLKNK